MKYAADDSGDSPLGPLDLPYTLTINSTPLYSELSTIGVCIRTSATA